MGMTLRWLGFAVDRLLARAAGRGSHDSIPIAVNQRPIRVVYVVWCTSLGPVLVCLYGGRRAIKLEDVVSDYS